MPDIATTRWDKKTGTHDPRFKKQYVSADVYRRILLTAAGGAAAASPSAYRHFRCDLKTAPHCTDYIIDGDVFGLVMEFFVHEQCEAVYLVYVVRLLRFVQNQRQSRTASPSRLQKNTDWTHLFALEVLIQNLLRFIRYMNHPLLLSFLLWHFIYV